MTEPKIQVLTLNGVLLRLNQYASRGSIYFLNQKNWKVKMVSNDWLTPESRSQKPLEELRNQNNLDIQTVAIEELARIKVRIERLERLLNQIKNLK